MGKGQSWNWGYGVISVTGNDKDEHIAMEWAAEVEEKRRGEQGTEIPGC